MSDTNVGIRNCRFKFECDQSWAGLQATEDASVRHCGQCSKSVHLCTTDADIARAIRGNLCVAIPEPNPTSRRKSLQGTETLVLGEPVDWLDSFRAAGSLPSRTGSRKRSR
jgi:hypothetical protein